MTVLLSGELFNDKGRKEYTILLSKILLRVLLFIPVIFALAVCESIIINKAGVDIADWQFYIISLLIMFVFVYVVFRYTGRFYVRSGICRFDRGSVLIQIKKKKIRITTMDIIRCECQEIAVYGTKIMV